jgi:hypothetical protein
MTQRVDQLTRRGPQPGSGDFIKSHLQHAGEDYIYHAYKAFCQSLKAIGQRGPSYDSFRKYWWTCAEMNLIEFVREQPIGNLEPRRYYRLVRSNINNEAWQNPQAALDLRTGRTIPDPATGKPVPVSRLGRRRYRRRVLGLPPKRVGRPRKPKPERGAATVATD